MHDYPATIVAVTVWAYWGCVLVLIVRSRLRYRRGAGALPHTARERAMWLLWLPAVLAWQVLPIASTLSRSFALTLPAHAAEHALWNATRWVAAAVAIVALGLTIPCWLGMGRDWTMAIVPRTRSRLITTGMFRRVRHPIYALSILLMLATIVAVPTPAMIIVGLVHLWMLRDKALSEERFLRQLHGDEYAAYCARTGRFWPRFFPSSDETRLAA